MEEYQPIKGIRAWAEDDRPREKLLLKGKAALSDAELIAILIGSGSTSETAVDLSKRILQSLNNQLSELAKLSVKDLTKFKGIGEAKAISIIAALELGRRRKDSEPEKRVRISDSRSAFDVLYPHLGDLNHEEFWVLFLNRAKVAAHRRTSVKAWGRSAGDQYWLTENSRARNTMPFLAHCLGRIARTKAPSESAPARPEATEAVPWCMLPCRLVHDPSIRYLSASVALMVDTG